MFMRTIQLTAEEVERLRCQTIIAARAMEEIFGVLIDIGNRTGKEWDPQNDAARVAEILDVFSSWHTEEITSEAVVERFGSVESWTEDTPEGIKA
jgi:hypothetical protein